MQTAQSIHVHYCVPWLVGAARNIYSQFGEDGLVAAVFGKIGVTNRCCFEIGAADGLFYSNTLQWREQGWRSVLIEKDQEQWLKMYERYSNRDTQCLFGAVTDLDRALRFSQFRHDKQPDFGVIDIDGQDYWMWHDLVEYRPRVMMVEIHPSEWEPVPPRGEAGQAGLASIAKLGAEKGYEVVAHTYCNALFVKSEELN